MAGVQAMVSGGGWVEWAMVVAAVAAAVGYILRHLWPRGRSRRRRKDKPIKTALTHEGQPVGRSGRRGRQKR